MKKLYCITCPSGCQLTVTGAGADMIVEGNKCKRGLDFAEAEMTNPTRILTTTVRTKFPGVPVISVRTDGEIPKDKLMDAMHELSEIVITEELGCGDTVLDNVADTGVRIIVTSSSLMHLGAELENKNIQLGGSGSPDGAGVAISAGPGVGIVKNAGILDGIGSDAADGIVGAAGEAVGVEAAEEEDKAEEPKDEGHIKPKGRPHITRR